MGFSIFLGLAIVFRIALFLYFITYGQFVDNDSALYITLAENLLEHQVFSESTSSPFSPEIFRTPGYPVFLALLTALGMEGANWTVFWQELIYGLSVFIFYRFGKTVFDPRMMRPGLIFLLIDPGGLVYPKLIMSEILFTVFFLIAMLLIAHYLRKHHWRDLVMVGVILGVGALIRPAIMYFPLVICGVLLFFACKQLKTWLHASLLLLSFMLVISPWLLRNYHYFGETIMTGAQSNILINYHVPIVMADAKGITRIQATDDINRLVQQTRQEKTAELGRPLTLVEGFHLEQKIAINELMQYPRIYLQQWIFGSLKTMNGPFITQLYDSLNIRQNRVHFSDSIATGFKTGIVHYVKNLDFIFLINVLLTLIMGGFALLGAWVIIKSKDPFLWIMMLANFYFICVPGPEGYPRFRFPIGIFWFIQACYGWFWLKAVCLSWRQKNPEAELSS